MFNIPYVNGTMESIFALKCPYKLRYISQYPARLSVIITDEYI